MGLVLFCVSEKKNNAREEKIEKSYHGGRNQSPWCLFFCNSSLAVVPFFVDEIMDQRGRRKV